MTECFADQMANGGRRLDGVWYYHTRSTDVRGNVKATCRGCGLEYGGIVSRMWRHVEQCPDLRRVGLLDGTDAMSLDESIASDSSAGVPPQSSECCFLSLLFTGASQGGASSSTGGSSVDLRTPAPNQKARLQMQIEPIRTDGDLKRKLDEQLARYVNALCDSILA